MTGVYGKRQGAAMADDPVDDPRAELALVEQNMAEVAKDVNDLRQELGDRSDGPGDLVDGSTLIEQLNVSESLLRDLESRRAELQQRTASPEGGDEAGN
jgi:hypothetical protein